MKIKELFENKGNANYQLGLTYSGYSPFINHNTPIVTQIAELIEKTNGCSIYYTDQEDDTNTLTIVLDFNFIFNKSRIKLIEDNISNIIKKIILSLI